VSRSAQAFRMKWCMASISALLLLLLPSCRSLASQSRTKVWDGVITTPAADRLHAFLESGADGDGNLSRRIFHRPAAPRARLSPLECALDSVLTELGDASPAVEYWTAREWRHVEAHASVDEALARTFWKDPGLNPRSFPSPSSSLSSWSQGDLRHPRNGHVLCLRAGSDVRGPTCIFGARSGADLGPGEKTDVTLVPPVGGRLMRFPGDALQSVPRPADLWFLPFVQGGPKYKPEELFGRSVVMFNTWPDGPPQDIREYDWDEADRRGSAECDDGSAGCVAGKEWRSVPVEGQGDGGAGEEAKVWLMGNEKRRGVPLRTVKVFAEENDDGPSMREALLHDTSRVTRFRIQGV